MWNHNIGPKIKQQMINADRMNTTKAPQSHPHSPARRLDAIKTLRHEHSRRFMLGEFSSMQTVGEKIVRAWADYHFACNCAREKHKCFNCCAEPKQEFCVYSPDSPAMLFCSAECRMEFGVSLGLT